MGTEYVKSLESGSVYFSHNNYLGLFFYSDEKPPGLHTCVCLSCNKVSAGICHHLPSLFQTAEEY